MRRRVWLLVAVAAASLTVWLAAGGALAANRRSCGTVVVTPAGGAAFYSVNRVRERGSSCAAAKRLVRAWARAAELNQLPARVVLATNRHGVIEYGRPGAAYRFRGHTCRWTNTAPGKSAFLPGRGRCQAGSAVITWSYHGATNPSIGGVTGCRSVAWRHGVITTVRARRVGCARARRVVSGALDHGVLGHSRGGLRVRRRVWDGFEFHAGGTAVSARRGRARIDFHVCWYNVDC